MNFLKQLVGNWKGAYTLYNFLHQGQLRKNKKAYARYGLKRAPFRSLNAEKLNHLNGQPPWLDRLISQDKIRQQPGFNQFSEKVQEQILAWSEQGYMILPKFFTKEEVNTINDEIERLVQDGTLQWRYGGNKLMFAYRHSPKIQKILSESGLKPILEFVLGTEVSLFQSINFYKGSNQKAHSDSVHMSTFPPGYLIAGWIALEDIQEGSGELEYYPGSHKLPYITNEHFQHGGKGAFLGSKPYDAYEDKIEEIVKENNLRSQTFLPEKGDILIWHANLLHGGSAVQNPGLSRKSMVLHYFADKAIAYHEITQRPALRG